MPRKGEKMSEEQKEKIRQKAVRRPRPDMMGSLNHNWKGNKITVAGGRSRAYSKFDCPKGLERHHIDGDPTNNNPANIEFLTHSEHMQKDGRLKKLHAFPDAKRKTAEWHRKRKEWAKNRPRKHGRFMSNAEIVIMIKKETNQVEA